MKFGPREKIITAAAVLAALVIGWYFLFYSKKKSEIQSIRNKITEMSVSINAENIKPELLDSLKQEIAKLEEKNKKEISLAVP
jgi:cell division protein FtsL